jgi:hypothetical protein
MIEQTINRQLKNYLDDVCTSDRVACFLKNGILEICIPESIFFNPVTMKGKLKKVYMGYIKINGSKLDKNIMLAICNKLANKQKVESQKDRDDKVKKKFGIQSKRVTEKTRTLISKYEEAINSNK